MDLKRALADNTEALAMDLFGPPDRRGRAREDVKGPHNHRLPRRRRTSRTITAADKLSPNVTAWRVEDIRDLIARLGAQGEETSQPDDPNTPQQVREAEDAPDA